MSEPDPTPNSPRALIITAIKWIIFAAIAAAVGRFLFLQLRAVPWSQISFDAMFTSAAVLCIIGVSLAQLVARWTLLLAYGYRLPWRQQFGVAFVPPLGKYLPGGVASVAGAVYLLRRFNVPTAVGLSVTMLLDGLAVLAGLIVSAPLLLRGPVREKMPLAWIPAAILVIFGLVVMHPRVFVGLANFALKRMKRKAIGDPPNLLAYTLPIVASFGQWLFAGLGLWCMTRAVHGMNVGAGADARLIPVFIGSAALAMTVSYLAPFAPAGLGVREGIYLLTLGPIIGSESAALISIAMRVIQTVIEVSLAGIGYVAMRRNEIDLTAEAQRTQRDSIE